MRFLTICGILVVLVLQSGVAYSRTTQQYGGDNGKNRAQQEQRGSDSLPLVVKVIPSQEATTQADEEKHDREESATQEQRVADATFGLVGVTAVLAIFTGGLWLATYRLAKDAKESSKKSMDLVEKQIALMGHHADILEKQKEISHQQFLAAHRPRIILREAYAVKDEGEPVAVHYTLANTGGVATRIIESAFAVTFEQIDGLHKGPDFVGKNEIGDVTIQAGAHKACEYSAPMNWRNGGVVRSGDWGYFFSGHVVYEDNGVMRHTAFFRVYDSATSRFIPINDPQLEYCDERT